MKKIICGICLLLLISCLVWAGDGPTVNVVQLAKSTTSWNGNTLPQYETGRPEITILRITIPPGVKLPLHTHPVINAGVLIHGKLTVVTEDNKILHLKAGDPSSKLLIPESCMKIDENLARMSPQHRFSDIVIFEHFTYMVKKDFFFFLINFHPSGESEASICCVTKGSQ